MVDRIDYFGNTASWIFLDRPHERFEVTIEAEVDVAFPDLPGSSATLHWEAVAQAARRGGRSAGDAAEFAFDSPMAPADAGAAAYAAASFPPGRPMLEGVLELNRRIRKDFAFKPGLTTLYTPMSKILTQRAGVCQDFAHLMITGLRSLGLPARYVSGYIRTRPSAGAVARRGADQSHAWVGAWLGPEHGWVDVDPTNDLVVSEEHVVLAWGRDYGDISPVRGILLGGGRHSVTVGVDVEPAVP
jgi:transglutaminase-like putative cysteine protease